MDIATDSNSSSFGFNNVDNLVFAPAITDRAAYFAGYDTLITSSWMSLSNSNQNAYYTLTGTFTFSDSSELSSASGTASSFVYLEYLGAGRGYDRVLFSNTSVDLNTLLFSTEWSGLLSGNDSITGGDNADTLSGYAGNDVITGGSGNDSITGGEGTDTAVFSGNIENYTISKSGDVITVSDRNGTDGRDTLTGIELLQFNDYNLAEADVGNEISEVNSLSIVVNEGVIGSTAVLLTGLTETVVYINGQEDSRTITYNGRDYNYNSVDSRIMTVTRNDAFTSEFQSEIAAYAPSAANITYQEAITLVGSANINNVLLTVAGADGNFVG